MSHFYASIKGNRGEATRGGSKDSGITGHIRGWDVGVRIDCFVDNMGNDTCHIFATNGSRNDNGGIHIGTVKLDSNGERFVKTFVN